MTKQCPPMSRLFYVPRANSMEGIAKKYPLESKKDRKARERAELRKRAVTRQKCEAEGIKFNLTVTVIKCRGLLLKNVMPFFSLNLLGEKYKTKPIKSSEPNWDASFTYSIIGVDHASELECVCFNNKMSSAEFIGELFLPVSRILELAALPEHMSRVWFPLRTNTSTKGEVNLRFSIDKTGKTESLPTDSTEVSLEQKLEESTMSGGGGETSSKVHRKPKSKKKSPRNKKKHD